MFGQIDVIEGSKSMVEGTYNAYTVSLENINEDEAKEGWEKFMKEFKGKVKRNKKAKLYISDNVQMPSLGSNPIDVYTMLTENKNATMVSVWFNTGSGYVNSIDMATQSETAKGMMKEYATNVLRKHAEEIQKKEEDSLKDLVNDAKDLENKNKDLRKDIAKAKAEILKWEKELDRNEDDKVNKDKAIIVQENEVKLAKEHTRKF